MQLAGMMVCTSYSRFAATAQTKWRCCYVLSTGIHTLTKSTMYGVEL